ncbi:MAG: hypothetical protein R3E82_19120 [Pseudomonadales bacterium]|nr:hypothetical protein [Pseudomonadales bacterium]
MSGGSGEEFSFKEKSLLISLLAILVLYGAYFLRVLGGEAQPVLTAMLQEMIGIVIALIVVHIVYHSVISLDDAPGRDDERDKAIDRRAGSISHVILVIAVITVLARILIVGAWGESADESLISLFEIANLLLAGLVASEVVHYAAQLYFYRRGL